VKAKGKAPTEGSDLEEDSCLFEHILETPSGATVEDTLIMRQATIIALSRSQAVLGACTDEKAIEIKGLSTTLNKILAILENKPANKPI
jgi:hypothetical protein